MLTNYLVFGSINNMEQRSGYFEDEVSWSATYELQIIPMSSTVVSWPWNIPDVLTPNI
jgi:hypothetical protein